MKKSAQTQSIWRISAPGVHYVPGSYNSDEPGTSMQLSQGIQHASILCDLLNQVSPKHSLIFKAWSLRDFIH